MRFVGIDPATKTGFVALDVDGMVLEERELQGEGRKEKGGITPEQLVSLENQLYTLLQPGDIIAIEQPAVGTQTAVTAGMIHGGLRTMIYRKSLKYDDVNPMRTKKFVGEGRRIPSNEKKAVIAAAVWEHYGYRHSSDNVTDAYIIARIAQALHQVKNGKNLQLFTPYQQDVIKAILYPADKTAKKPKTNKRRGQPATAVSYTQSTEQGFLF